MKDSVLAWLANGETGLSSKTMAFTICDIDFKQKYHPSDPADLRRCLLFLKAVPEAKEHMDKLRNISKTWSLLIDRWDEIESLLVSEVGQDWKRVLRAPKTYELMKSIEAAGRSKDKVGGTTI